MRAQCVERMFEIRRHRSRMRQQRNAPAFELALQFHVAQQAVDSELDHEWPLADATVGQSSSTTKLSG